DTRLMRCNFHNDESVLRPKGFDKHNTDTIVSSVPALPVRETASNGHERLPVISYPMPNAPFLGRH
ncbi:hypothetical protein J6590_105625, partial [Homalodisca vitripennis]